MKYMLMMNGPRDACDHFARWPEQDIEARNYLLMRAARLSAT